MIDVKIIKKPKTEGAPSARQTAGTAYGSRTVKEAAHAARADMAELAKVAEKAREADRASEAAHAAEAEHAREAENADRWDGRHFDDYLDQPVRRTDDATFATVTTDSIRSAGQFVDGLLGSGFRLWRDEDGRTRLTIDKLTVRQTMAVMELLAERIRSVGGQIVVSAANGRIKTVEEQEEHYLIRFEQDNGFMAHDLMRCSMSTGEGRQDYWVEVADAAADGIVVAKSEFGSAEPKAGDECVLMGNTRDKLRQNLILLAATEDGQPRVDVLDGVSAKYFDNCLRVRLGNLDGIRDDSFPAARQPKGNGLYADNAYLKGTFVLETGEDVKTRFEIAEGRMQSSIDSVRNDILSERGYLNNPAFTSGLEMWTSENEATFYLVGNRWVWANGAPLSKKGNGVSVVTDMGRRVLRIRDRYIRQKHGNLRQVPAFPANREGRKEALPVYLSFFYRCASPGTLKVGFENVDKTGFADFDSMEVSEEIARTEGYVQYTCRGMWNGTGDFRLSFTGEMYLYMLVLSTDKADALAYRYRTLFEQSDRLIRLTAGIYDNDEKALKESGVLIRPEGSGIYAQTADGRLALIGVATEKDGKTVIQLTSDNIRLEGIVTANGNFRILEDGSVETNNAKVKGYVYSVFKNISESDAELLKEGRPGFEAAEYKLRTNLYVDATGCSVVLPVSEAYEGARVIIMDSGFVRTRVSTPPTTIRTENGSQLVSGLFARGDMSVRDWLADQVRPDAGTVELTLQNMNSYDDEGRLIRRGLRWVLIGSSCRNLYYTYQGKDYDCRNNVNKLNQ